MFSQLAAEIYNKADGGNEEVDDVQVALKNIPPFPYRIAKALDPNIYRNTDFDIWHEIRRGNKVVGICGSAPLAKGNNAPFNIFQK